MHFPYRVFPLWLAAVPALAAPISLNWAHTNLNLVTNPDSVSQTAGGVTVTARGYTVEFSGSVATVFGPFPTTPGAGSLQVFGTFTSGLTTQPGLGLLSQPLTGLAVGGSDIGGGNAVRSIDSWPYQSDNLNVAGAPPRKLEFVLFEFSELVDVSAVVVESLGNSFNTMWAAGGATAPNLGLDLLTALAGYTFVNPPFQAPGTVSHTVALSGVRYLLVGAQAPPEVGNFGPIAAASLDSSFYINGLDIATIPGGTTTGTTTGGTTTGGTTGGGASPVPEPSAFGLLAAAGAALAAVRHLRRAQ